MKRNIVIFSLIMSIISFIFILLMYFGITRYMFICTGSIDGYLEKYRKNKTTNKYKIVATIQVNNAKEMKDAEKTIKSLLDQTKSVDKICLHTKIQVPESYKRAVSVYKTSDNHIASCLSREKEADTKIIAVKAGKVYAKDLIENLCKSSDEHPHCVICVKGEKNIDTSQGVLTKPELYKEIKPDFDIGKESKYIHKAVTEKAL